MEVIGYIGGILLAVCGVPELIRTVKNKVCNLGWGFILLWFFGELFMFWYILDKPFDGPLFFNYLLNLLMVGIMLYYKVRPSNKKSGELERSISID